MLWWNMDAYKWSCEMDMDEQTVSFEWAFLLRSEEDEFELMSSTEPIFKLKPRDLRGAVLRGWGPQREAEFCVLSLPTSPHRLDLDCKLTTSFIRERLNDIITQSQPQSASPATDTQSKQRNGTQKPLNWWISLWFEQNWDEFPNNCNIVWADCRL